MKQLMIVAVATVMSGACTSVSPDAGQEAVLIQKPCCFGAGGISGNPIATGKTTYVALTTDAIYVNVLPQTFSLQINDLMTKDGVPLDFQASVRMRVTNSPLLVEKFGADEWYQRNLQQPFFEMIRDSVKKRGMNEMAIDASASDAVDGEVEKALRDYVKAMGLPVEVLDVNLGAANPPDAIKTQRTETAAQEQRANTEKQRKLAEDQRKEAEFARAAADNAYRQAMQLSPDQFLQLEQIKMLHDVCGGGKCTVMMGGGVVPTMNVK